jgi:hypothetical protein
MIILAKNLNPIAHKRLTRDIQRISKTDTVTQVYKTFIRNVYNSKGYSVVTINDGLWQLFFFNFEPSTFIFNDLQAANIVKCVINLTNVQPNIQLEIDFPVDFPISPPKVRIVQPRFHQVPFGGILELPQFSQAMWSPGRDIVVYDIYHHYSNEYRVDYTFYSGFFYYE